MSFTHTAVDVPHVLIQRQGARPGSLHAAVPQGAGWLTACGESMADGPRGTFQVWAGAAAHQRLQEAPGQVCRRCSRVGDTVES